MPAFTPEELTLLRILVRTHAAAAYANSRDPALIPMTRARHTARVVLCHGLLAKLEPEVLRREPAAVS